MPLPKNDGESPPDLGVPMPEAIHYVYFFEFFNTASLSIVLGSPILLYFQHLNASATILACVACTAPFLNLLQLPAARVVERVGYRRFVSTGWLASCLVILGMAVSAFLPASIPASTRIFIMLGLSFLYSALRGFFNCGLLPWFTHLVPERRRGEFLAKDQLAGAAASITCLLLSALLLSLHHIANAFGFVFLLAGLAAVTSLTFIHSIPEGEVIRPSVRGLPLGWGELLRKGPFLKYVRYNLVANSALGASGVFVIRFFRTVLKIPDAGVLLVTCLFTLVLSLLLLLIGPLLDRAGNKAALMFSGLFFICDFSVLGLVAAGVIPFSYFILVIHVLVLGLASALWNLSNTRAIMGVVPVKGRPYSLALYNVLSNLVVGLAPLVWGPTLDHLYGWHARWGFWQWNSYSLFYCVLTGTMILSLIMLRSVVEPTAMSWNLFVRELLIKGPARSISLLIQRIR